MQRSDYAYRDLPQSAYQTIIGLGTMQGMSPLLPKANYDALIRESRSANIDPRIALAWLLWEDHFGTDPGGGIALAKVFNFAGIKWAGQPGAFDSGIQVPPNEQPGTYAGFPDVGAFIHELYRTLTNEYCGPYFNAGDLANAASVYITGQPNTGRGQGRVDTFLGYQRDYPSQGATPVADGVYGEDLIRIMAAHGNEERSDGTLDSWNAPHLWEGWCQASTEGVRAAAGLDVTHRASAAAQLDIVSAQGLLQQGRPEHGAIVMWGRSFDPSGHTCLWDDDKGAFLSTLYGPSRIGYFYSDGWYNAMAGWWRAPGVVAARRDVAPSPPPPPPPDYVLLDGNTIPIPLWAWSRWDALNTMGQPLNHAGAVNPDGLAMPTYGYPVKKELVLPTGRKLMFFERAVMATQSAGAPWDVVTLGAREAAPYVDY